MTELEQRLMDMLRLSQQESQEREQRLMTQVNSLQEQVATSAQQVMRLAGQQKILIERYEEVADLLKEELER
jgi:hypothetical protein